MIHLILTKTKTMKKIYQLFFLGMLFSVSVLRAQLSGIYTIDNTLAPSATNFTSFTQFASALNTQGVTGSVTVNVGAASGPYTEQVEFLQYGGASATNSVLINGNGRTITFNATNAALRHTLMLSGADFMTWKNLTVIGTNATNALVVHLWNGADNNTFENMFIDAGFNSTSTSAVPFSISGSSVSATTAGNCGNGNVVNTCTIIGGYYNTVFFGNSITPFNINNEVRNSVMRDFYLFGFYNLYCLNTKVIGNTVDRLNRTLVSTTYAIYLSTGSTANGLVEGNFIRNLFNGISGNTSTTYGIYLIADATASAPNIVRNNVISDINSNGLIYGIISSGADFAYFEHNTVSLDDPLNTSGTTYAIYTTGLSNRVRNNNVTIGRAGTGTKYGLYYTTAATNLISNYNNVYISTTAGVNYYGFYTTNYSTLSTWKAGTTFDANSLSVDPQYVNTAAFNYAPSNLSINNQGLPVGVLFDVLGASRSALAPDPGAYEIYNTPCASAPPSNSFIVPSGSVCPGAQIPLTLQTTNTYTNSGYAVQWYSSVNSAPFQSIPGATLNTYVTTPATTNVNYYSIITCVSQSLSTTTLPGAVNIMPLVQDQVPYYESFETPAQNGLPNCYWDASNFTLQTKVASVPASGNRAARTGNGYAFFENKATSNYFYTNQIYLKTGITYSAALWYITENIGFGQWPDLSILLGTSQVPAGLQPIASANPVTGSLYNLLSNTFSVATTGYYYVAVRATGSITGVAPFMTWDDLSITIPCALNSNTVAVIAPTVPVCQGAPTTLMAGGAPTYSWSNGALGPINIVSPITNSTYIVSGIDTLSGCSNSVAINLTVTPAPAVGAIASSYSICTGQTTTLSAFGANTYYWSNGSTNSITVVSPTVSGSYNVAGTNLAGCTSTYQVLVQVSAPPALNPIASNSIICQGESTQLSAQGASSYVWLAPSLYNTNSQVTVNPSTTTMYTVTGTTSNGCTTSSQVLVLVKECTGLEKHTLTNFNIFPNPASDKLFIKSNGEEMTIKILDVSGRVLSSQLVTNELITIDLTRYSEGIYYVQASSNTGFTIEKFIKH